MGKYRNINEIGEKLGCSRSTVNKILQVHPDVKIKIGRCVRIDEDLLTQYIRKDNGVKIQGRN